MPDTILTLPDATVSLFASNDAGTAAIGEALWSSARVQNMRMAYRFDEQETFPTGLPYAQTKHINERHEISIGQLWVQEATPFEMVRNAFYVLKVAWVKQYGASPATDAIIADVSRIYYGVMPRNFDLSGDIEFAANITFKANFFR
jgi:hypothetical protein